MRLHTTLIHLIFILSTSAGSVRTPDPKRPTPHKASEVSRTQSFPNEAKQNLLSPAVTSSDQSHFYYGGRRIAPPTTAHPPPTQRSSTLLEPVIIHHSKKTSSPSDNLHTLPNDNSIRKSSTATSTCPSGECLSPATCRQHGGTVVRSQSCYPLQCCQFHRSCGEVTSPHDKTTFFNSPPTEVNPANASSFCSLEVHTLKTTCAVRLSFLKFRLSRAIAASPSAVKCPVDSFYVLNSQQGWNEPLCQAENHTAILYVHNGTSMERRAPLTLLIVAQSISPTWSVKIDQIDCTAVKPWTNEPECGRQLMYEEDSGSAVEESPDQQLSHSLIVRGQAAASREFPWQVSIQSNAAPYSHRCGGSVLNKNHILTASHCIARNAYTSGTKLRIVAGTLSLNFSSSNEEEEEDSYSTHSIASVIFHYHYSPHKSQLNDIAVIRLEEPLEYSSKVQPVCLPSSSHFKTEGLTGWVSGWGRLNATDNSPSSRPTILQKLQVKILSDDTCQDLVKQEVRESLKRNVKEIELETVARLGRTHTQLCAQAPLTTAVCFGDSGGPLVVVNEDDGTYTQVGIVSYGLGKCITNRNPPGAYTRVSEYLNFIALATS